MHMANTHPPETTTLADRIGTDVEVHTDVSNPIQHLFGHIQYICPNLIG